MIEKILRSVAGVFMILAMISACLVDSEGWAPAIMTVVFSTISIMSALFTEGKQSDL